MFDKLGETIHETAERARNESGWGKVTNEVRDVLSQAIQKQLGVETPTSKPMGLSYIVTDNNTGKEDYVKVIYDLDSRTPVAIKEYFDNGGTLLRTSKDNIEKFFDKLNSKENYTVTSGPIDITDVNKIPQDYNDYRASVYYDTDAYGKLDSRDIFNLDNRDYVNKFGTRKARRFTNQMDRPYRSFSDDLRESLMLQRTGRAERPVTDGWDAQRSPFVNV